MVNRALRPVCARNEHPPVKIQDDPFLVSAVLVRAGPVGCRAVLAGDRPQAQRSEFRICGFGPGQHLAPGVDRISGEAGRGMCAGVDRGDQLGVLQAVETEGAGERDDVPAIDNASAEPAGFGHALVEMHPCGVLPQPGGDLVLGLLDRDSVDMVDPLTGFVVFIEMRSARQSAVILACGEAFGQDE